MTAEQTGWTLAFSDDFKRNELGKDWVIVEGDWKVTDGCLRGSGILLSAQGFPQKDAGFQRLEFEAVTDVQPIIFFPDKPKPKVVVGDISSFIHAGPGDPFKTGYFFQFGGVHNTVNKIQRQGAAVVTDTAPKNVITPDKAHHVIVENDKGRLRLIVDGQTLLDHREKTFLLGNEHNRVGLFFYTASKVSNVKVYVKTLPNNLDLY